MPGKELRIVDVKDWDVEACGGTHCSSTGEVGEIKIVNSKRIQDGIVRLEYKAGQAFHKNQQKIQQTIKTINPDLSEKDLKEMARIFSVSWQELPSTLSRFENEWQQQKEQLREFEEEILENRKLDKETEETNRDEPLHQKYKEIPPRTPEGSKKLFREWKLQKKDLEKARTRYQKYLQGKINQDIEKQQKPRIIKEITYGLEVKNLKKIVKKNLKKDSLIILANKKGSKVNFVIGSQSQFNARQILEELTSKLGGGGSGNEKMAIGGGSSKGLKKVLEDFQP